MNKKFVMKGTCLILLTVAILCMSYEYYTWNDYTSPVSSVLKGEKEETKVAYLTFDDGPSMLSSRYLDILKEENVNATFFVIGQQVCDEMEDVVKRAIDSVLNQTYKDIE